MYKVLLSFGVNAVYSADVKEIIFCTSADELYISPTLVITLPDELPLNTFIEPLKEDVPVVDTEPDIVIVPNRV
jgi:hypothetical protein